MRIETTPERALDVSFSGPVGDAFLKYRKDQATSRVQAKEHVGFHFRRHCDLLIAAGHSGPINVFEAGFGGGDLTVYLLYGMHSLKKNSKELEYQGHPAIVIYGADDSEKCFEDFSKSEILKPFLATGRVHIQLADALVALQSFPDKFFYALVQGFCVHNMPVEQQKLFWKVAFKKLAPGAKAIMAEKVHATSKRANPKDIFRYSYEATIIADVP